MYQKDRQLESYQHRLRNIQSNLDSAINARLFEKGNQLIYSLDQTQRQLKLFKHNYFSLEQKLAFKIRQEQYEKFKRNTDQILRSQLMFQDYKSAIMAMIEADFA